MGLGGIDAQVQRALFAARREARAWVFDTRPPDLVELEHARRLGFEAVVGHLIDPEVTAYLAETGVPLIDLSGRATDPCVTRVCMDSGAVGAMAADFLIERGYRAFMTYPHRTTWESARLDGFRTRVTEAGFAFIDPSTNEALEAWIAGRSKGDPPFAVFAAYDRYAQRIASLLRAWEVSVPIDAGVLGVDNTELLCELETPALSSIAQPIDRIAGEVIRRLDAYFADGSWAPATVTFPPAGVVERASTDHTMIDDPQMARALQLIREHATKGAGTRAIAEALGLKRTTFTRRFKRATGREPSHELNRIRLDAARRMLIADDQLVKRVAYQCGFADMGTFFRQFRQAFGLTPTQFRKRQAEGGG